jgi:hypothetical protein
MKLLFLGVALLAIAPPSQAAIDYISVTTSGGGFTPSGGTYGIGLLSYAASNVVVTVERPVGVQSDYVGGSFSMATSLFQDLSSGGVVSGDFRGGSISFKDSAGADILAGSLSGMALQETVSFGRIYLVGSGQFVVNGGSLATEFGTAGDLVSITVRLAPLNPTDLKSSFSGPVNLTVSPVPEPTTLALLGLSSLSLLRRRRA